MRILEDFDKGILSDFNLYDAMCLLERAWLCITSTTIANAYRHAGLSADPIEAEENIPLSEWIKQFKLPEPLKDLNMDEFVEIDADISTSADLGDDGILASIASRQQSANDCDDEDDDDDDVDETEVQPPTTQQALDAARLLTRFFQHHGDNDAALQRLLLLENEVEDVHFHIGKKQTKITNFFTSSA